MKNYQTLWSFRLSRITLALTYILYLLLVIGSQFQKKILKDKNRS